VTTNKTPSAEWREAGQDDPHGDRYSCEREALALGHLSDDQLANAVFAHNHRELDLAAVMSGESSSITLLTAAKQRIRWLSRKLVATEQEVEQLHRQIDALKMQLADKQYAFYQRGKTLDSVRQKRDQLKAQNNQLRTALKAMNSHLNYIPALDLTVDEVLAMSPNQSLAVHDAEVIDQVKRALFNEGRIRTCITKWEFDIIANQLHQPSNDANQLHQPSNDGCELECGAHGTLCRCNAEQAEEGYQ
jgi:uncharacterized phage infection (PIP) family protein YhgE